MVQIYAGLRDQELRAAAAAGVDSSCAAGVRRDGHLVGTLRVAGVELWAVSSTNRWVVSEGVRLLGFPKSECWRPRCGWLTA